MLYKIFHRNPDSRDDVITMTSGLGIVVNLLIATIKVLIGVISSSIAIVSEGVNNLADAFTSILALVGAKLAKKHPDEKHPFGYGRIEYLASLVISTLILVTGIEMMISSIKLVFHPAEMSVSYLAIAIVAGTAIIKYILGGYTIKMGEKASSVSLIGVGTECRNDSFASIITIITALIYLLFHVSLDAYAGIIISLLIVKAGIDVLKETLSDLLGRPGEKELAKELYQKIRQTEGIIAAADMMLHNYGPDSYSGSVNVEIDHEKTIGEAYAAMHALQLKIMHEHNIVMVFGMYAVDSDHDEIKLMRTQIASFVREREHVQSYHALYIDPDNRDIYCDLVVDYELRDWDGLRNDFSEYMRNLYPESRLELVIETAYV